MRPLFALCLLPLLSPLLPTGARAQGPTALDELAWMAGAWGGQDGQIEMEEHWLAPKGGLMLGLHRDWRAQAPRASFEYLRIEVRGDELVYVASPGGRGAVDYRLVEARDGRAVFENPEHDFPQRIIYERRGQELRARVEDLEGARASEWSWRLLSPDEGR